MVFSYFIFGYIEFLDHNFTFYFTVENTSPDSDFFLKIEDGNVKKNRKHENSYFKMDEMNRIYFASFIEILFFIKLYFFFF